MVTRNFALLTASPKVLFKDLAPVAAAVMRQINDHFYRFWGELGTVTPFADQSQVPLASCRITVVEGRPNGLLGVHRASNNQPYAYVSDEDQWSVAVSHEILEILVDPTLSLFRAGTIGNPPQRMNFLVEVCDPCQAVAYAVDGIGVSDFVTPAYFDPQAVPGAQYSFMGAVKAPHTVAPGGYVVWQDPVDGMYYAFTSDGVNGQTMALGNYPQGAGSTPREWADSVLRKDPVPWHEETLDSLRAASAANALAAKRHAKYWTDELRALRRLAKKADSGAHASARPRRSGRVPVQEM